MVLESIIGEKNIRKQPFLILIITFLVSIGSIIFAQAIFPKHASILSIAFITIALVPMLHNIFAKEEYDEVLQRKSFTTFFARHFNLIMLYVWVFIGIILAFSVAYVAAPADVKPLLFEEQINSFCYISGQGNCQNGVPFSLSGKALSPAFDACQNAQISNVFSCTAYIFENNAGVLIFTILLSLLYGAGAIFIIAWNASILGLFFGEMILAGQHIKWIGLLQGMLIGHGPPELLGYVFGALAGAILSVMVSKGVFLKHEFSIVLKDVLFLTLLAIFSVFYGAVVEAIGIMQLGELYYALGFVYVLAIIILVFLYGKKRINPFSAHQ